MADVKWIKIATDIFEDEKILLIESMPDADAIIVIWLKLLVFAGKQNNKGVFMMNNAIPYTDEMLAAIFRRPLNTVRLAISTFEKFGMVQIYDEVITIPNWEKHQSLDKLEKLAQQNRDRVKRHREKQKAIANGNVTLQLMQSNAPDIDKDKDKDLESSSYTDIWKALSTEQIDLLMETYQEGGNLIQEVYEQVKAKRKIIEKPYEYVIGYAENKKWLRSAT